jgi:hypothetical protein
VLKVLLVLIIIAIATYALVRVVQRRGVATPRRGAVTGARDTRPAGPLGPDDDEDFLRDLDRRRLNGDGTSESP